MLEIPIQSGNFYISLDVRLRGVGLENWGVEIAKRLAYSVLASHAFGALRPARSSLKLAKNNSNKEMYGRPAAGQH